MLRFAILLCVWLASGLRKDWDAIESVDAIAISSDIFESAVADTDQMYRSTTDHISDLRSSWLLQFNGGIELRISTLLNSVSVLGLLLVVAQWYFDTRLIAMLLQWLLEPEGPLRK